MNSKKTVSLVNKHTTIKNMDRIEEKSKTSYDYYKYFQPE